MSLSARAQSALESCGLNGIKSFEPERRLLGFRVLPAEGSASSAVEAKVMRLQAEDSQVFLVDRHTLTCDLLEGLRQSFSVVDDNDGLGGSGGENASVKLHFDSKVLSVNLKDQSVSVQVTRGEQSEVQCFSYDLLVGAEGAGGSAVRKTLEGRPHRLRA